MHLNSLVEPIYYPDADQQTVLRLGLENLPLERWLHIDADFHLFQQHKLQQAERDKTRVFAALENSVAAQQEFGNFLRNHLINCWPDHYKLSGEKLYHTSTQLSWPADPLSLWESCLWIQDDICLLESADQNTDQEYILTAASLCSPSNWKLEDKIGHTVDRIHDPVPGYQQQLAERVNKLLAGLKPGKPVLRYNWSVQAGNELCWRDDVASESAEDYYWRVERQTLLKLPQTGAIVFAIRIFLHSFAVMELDSQFRANLSEILLRQSEDLRHYKGLDAALLERLQGKQ